MLAGVPSEVQFLGLYIPPLFVVIMVGLVGAMAVGKLLNLTGFSRFFWHPALARAGLWLLASALVGLFVIAP